MVMQVTDTKEMILQKTFELLLSKGYDGVSITDIQNATEMSRGLLYHYFGNKEALFVEVTQKYFVTLFHMDIARIQNYTVQEMIAYMLEKYTTILSATFTDSPAVKGNTIMNYDFLFYRVMQENALFAQKYQEIRGEEVLAWQIALQNSLICGELREGTDPGKTSRYFVYLMDGVWMNAVNRGKSDTMVADFKEVLEDFYHLLRNQ